MAQKYVMSVDSQARDMAKDWKEGESLYNYSMAWFFQIDSISIDLRHDDSGVSRSETKPQSSSETYDLPIDPWFWMPTYLSWLSLPTPSITVNDINFTASSPNTQLKWDFYNLPSVAFTTKKTSSASAQETSKGLAVGVTFSDSIHLPSKTGKYDVNLKAYISADADIYTVIGSVAYEAYANTLFYELKGKPLQLKHTSYDLQKALD